MTFDIPFIIINLAAALIKKDERLIHTFHKFSVGVWVIWLIPYFSPLFFALA